MACLTTASARICPSCTRKCSLAWTPSAFGSGVSMNKPPMLMSRTRETSSRPRHFQYTHTSPGAGTRDVNLLDGDVAGREDGFPNTMVLRIDRSNQHKQGDMTVVSKFAESFHRARMGRTRTRHWRPVQVALSGLQERRTTKCPKAGFARVLDFPPQLCCRAKTGVYSCRTTLRSELCT